MSIKARFQQRQPPVDVRQIDGIVYVFICQNEMQGEENYPDMGDGKKTEIYYEYDYNEITGPVDKIPLEDIQAHPENYLDYEYADFAGDPVERALAEIEELKRQIANTNAQMVNNVAN